MTKSYTLLYADNCGIKEYCFVACKVKARWIFHDTLADDRVFKQYGKRH